MTVQSHYGKIATKLDTDFLYQVFLYLLSENCSLYDALYAVSNKFEIQMCSEFFEILLDISEEDDLKLSTCSSLIDFCTFLSNVQTRELLKQD